MDNIQKYFVMICFTGYLREMAKMAMAATTDEDKKAFALTGGKREFQQIKFDLSTLTS